jgi:hypothetical protein
MNNTIVTSVTGLLAFAACSLHGSPLFADYFDYGNTNANLGTLSPWGPNSEDEIRYVAANNSSFSHPSYVLTSGNLNTGRVESFLGAQRTNQAPLSATALTGEIWFSGLHAMAEGAGNGAYTMFSLGPLNARGYNNSTSDISTHFGIVSEGGSYLPVVATGSGNNWGTTRTLGTDSLTAGTTYLFVARANTATSTFDLWVFDEDDVFGTTVASLGVPHVTTSNAALTQVTRVGLGRFGAEANGSHWDALRVSNTAGDAGLQAVIAIPEPRVYAALFGLFALGVALWRRRR